MAGMDKISVVGLGFVGLSLAAVNSKKGFYTVGIDSNDEKINGLKKGIPDFYEPQLEDILKKSIKNEKIRFTTDISSIRETDITFLTVGTPSKVSGEIDLSFVKKAVSQINSALKDKKRRHMLVVKSTLAPLTTKNVIRPIVKTLIEKDRLVLVVNPEFLKEGFAIKDLSKPHLILIGEDERSHGMMLERYYRKFYSKMPEVIHTDYSNAELIKYANNAFLATKISFINSIANVCQNIPNSDVNAITYAISKDPRTGPLFLKAGPGFGGSCLPKDLKGLIHYSKKQSDSDRFFEAVKNVNDLQPKKIVQLMKEMGVYKKGRTVSILGLAFKKDTDDIREAISVKIAKLLLRRGIKIKVHDPMAMANFEKIFDGKIEYSKSVASCLKNSDCCLILTEWDTYRRLGENKLRKIMKRPRVIDARRIFEPEKFSGIDFKAIGLGR